MTMGGHIDSEDFVLVKLDADGNQQWQWTASGIVYTRPSCTPLLWAHHLSRTPLLPSSSSHRAYTPGGCVL